MNIRPHLLARIVVAMVIVGLIMAPWFVYQQVQERTARQNAINKQQQVLNDQQHNLDQQQRKLDNAQVKLQALDNQIKINVCEAENERVDKLLHDTFRSDFFLAEVLSPPADRTPADQDFINRSISLHIAQLKEANPLRDCSPEALHLKKPESVLEPATSTPTTNDTSSQGSGAPKVRPPRTATTMKVAVTTTTCQRQQRHGRAPCH